MRELMCDQVQGYLLGCPMQMGKSTPLMEKRARRGQGAGRKLKGADAACGGSPIRLSSLLSGTEQPVIGPTHHDCALAWLGPHSFRTCKPDGIANAADTDHPKFSFSPGVGHDNVPRRPLSESVTYAVRMSAPPKQMLVG